jgi:Leucine rich repeat
MNNATNGDDQDRVGGFPQTTASASLDSPLGGADPPDTGDDDNDNFVNNPVPEEAPPLQQHKEEEDPLEKQRRREKKEFRIVLGVAALILVVVVVIVTAVVVSHQKNEAAANQAEATPSPTPAPTSKLVQEPQAKLDYLFWDIDHNNFTKAYRGVLSEKASDMEGKYKDETQHPVTRAMSWLFDDTNSQESNLLRRLGLAALYYSNGGDDWTNKENWLSSESHCSWHGVQCCKEDDLNYVLKGCQGDARDTIVFLDLRGNNVSRNLTNVFAFLQDLRSLDLSSNALTGALPGDLFGSMPNLFMLSLQNNDLTGTVPGGLTGNGVLGTERSG